MGTLLTNTCWPVHFPTKWLACFGIALFAGTAWGVHQHHPSPPSPPPIASQIQARIIVLAKYAGETGYKRVRAKVYFGRRPEEMLESQVIRVGVSEPGIRTQAARVPIDFMVQPLTSDGNAEGVPVHLLVNWPEHKNDEVPLQIERTYPRPKH